MSTLVEHTSEQLNGIIVEEKRMNQCSRVVPKQVDAEEALDPDNSSSVMNSVLNTTDNKFNNKRFLEIVWLRNAHVIWQS